MTTDSVSAAEYVARAGKERHRTKAKDGLERFIDNLGCGTWEREFKFLTDRRFRFDYANVGLRLALEYDGMHGGAHGSVNGLLRDSEKVNLAQLNGWLVIRCNAKTLESGQAYTWIEEAVRQRTEAAA